MTEIVLHDGPCDALTARQVRDLIDALVPAALRIDIALVATELITNAMRAGATAIEVAVAQPPSFLTLSVRDDAPGIPTPRRPDASELSGRGLQIIEAIADQWGHQPTDSGKVVWARFARSG